MKHSLAILIAASVASVSFVAWRMEAMKHMPANDSAEVYDPSLSFTGGCSSLVGTAEQLLRNPAASDSSTLTVLALGDNATAREPRRLTTYLIPVTRRVIEGSQAVIRQRAKILQDLWAKCDAVHPTEISPIFLGVQQALADLHADGCKMGFQCKLWIATDLEENADHAIQNEINGSGEASRSTTPLLDNRGVAVTFCGFADTAGRVVGPSGREIGPPVSRGPRRDDRLQAVWRSLFARPKSVDFQPYCPQPTILPEHTGNTG